MAVITATTPRPQARRPCTAMHDGRRRDTATIVHSHITRNHAYKGTCPRDTTRHATRQPNKRSNVAYATNPWVGEGPPGRKTGAAGSLVLTLNARWNIFGLPVTYEVFTYLVVATVSAPYILCIMFLGLMLMVVERSSGPHRYLAAITHCA